MVAYLFILHNSRGYGFELSLQCISDENLAKKITLTGNYEELRNFIKKIGSNLLLREREVGLAWQNGWELLAKHACGCGAGGHEFSECTTWQGSLDKFRTLNWKLIKEDYEHLMRNATNTS